MILHAMGYIYCVAVFLFIYYLLTRCGGKPSNNGYLEYRAGMTRAG